MLQCLSMDYVLLVSLCIGERCVPFLVTFHVSLFMVCRILSDCDMNILRW